MEILTETIYRCDICGKESKWIDGQWIAHEYPFKNYEHEFHVCSKQCDEKLADITKKQRGELITRITNGD